jgi:hypothetical protein
MIKHGFYVLILPIICLFVGCNSSISADQLYGKWKYIKIEHPNDDPPVMPADQLNNVSPYIEFSKNNTYLIMWGGRVISHGKFKPDGRNIQITETLPDSSTRNFPFWVSELSDGQIVFQSTGENNSKVTAVKE